MSEFLKNGDNIVPKPKGNDYDLENGVIYRLKQVRGFMSVTTVLIKDGHVDLPNRVYIEEDNNFLINRIIKDFNTTKRNTTGVLFHGETGCGKTFLSKLLAKNINLPIIIVDPSFDTRKLIEFFTSFNKEVIILFDELDKHCNKNDNWDTLDLLEFLDGNQNTCKKLVVFTCNDDNVVNKFLKNRCGRIKYYKKFDVLSKEVIHKILSDYIEQEKVNEVEDYILNNVKLPSYDNIVSICEELRNWKEYPIKNLLKDLNINKV